MKYYIASLILIGFLMVGKVMGQPKCEPGYYDAGGFCKAEPTSCAYGDSLNKDTCAKFQEPVEAKPAQKQVTEPVIYGGK